MNAVMIATAVALGIAASGALAHGDEHKEMMQGNSSGGHAGAVGTPGDPNKVTRAVEVLMSDDMRFTPSRINVQRGETVKFVLKNAGQVRHEMVIGSMAELKGHAEMMRKMPGMEHADPNMVSVEPGKSGELVWRFTRTGAFDFACLIPGHLEAGMVGKVSVK